MSGTAFAHLRSLADRVVALELERGLDVLITGLRTHVHPRTLPAGPPEPT